jgi:O-antigen/teichoic acid export membrane protein
MLISKKLTFRVIAEITGLLLGAVSMIYVSRIVGPEYLGFSATTSAILLFVSRLADGGLTSQASQRLARDDEKLSSLLAVTVPPKIVASAVLIAFTMFIVNLLPIDQRLKYFISISVFMVFFETCAPVWVFVALGKVNIASVIRIGQSILSATSIFLIIHKPDDWIYLPYLTLFGSFINFFLGIYLLIHCKLHYIDIELFKNEYLKKIIESYRDSIHFLKADLSVYVYTVSDRLILYYFTNAYTVGIYEAAYKIINPFYAINAVITPTMFRELAQSFKQGKLYPVMAKYVFSMSIFAIPLGFFLLFFSQDVVTLLYGTKFVQSTNCLMILGFVITFGFTGGIIVLPFSAWNMSREYGTSIFWGNVLNTVLNFSLIPFWGAIGAALATLAAKIIVTVVGYIFFRKTTDYPIGTDFFYFFLASAFPLILLLPLHQMGVNHYALMWLYGAGYLFCATLLYRRRFRRLLS